MSGNVGPGQESRGEPGIGDDTNTEEVTISPIGPVYSTAASSPQLGGGRAIQDVARPIANTDTSQGEVLYGSNTPAITGQENSEEVSSFLLELLPQLTQLYLFAFAISLQWESTLSRPARTSACSWPALEAR